MAVNRFRPAILYRLSLWCAVLAQLLTAMNITGSKYLTAGMPVLFLMETRFIIGSLALAAVALARGPALQRRHIAAINTRQWLALIAQGLCAGTLFNLLILLGLQYTSASMAGVITSSLPAMVVLAMMLLLGLKPRALEWLCLGFAVLGLLIINIGGLASPAIGLYQLMGDGIVLLALVPESLYYVISKAVPLGMPPLLGSLLINLANALILAPILLFISYDFVASTSLLEWLLLIFLGVASGLFYLLWSRASQHIDAATTGMLTALMPVFTLLLSWLCLNEGITLVQALGMLCILISILIGNTKQ